MPKTTKQMIKVSIIAYIPAPNVLDRESFEKCHQKLKKIEDFMKAETDEIYRFTKDPIGRQYEIEQPDAPEGDSGDGSGEEE